MEITVLKYLLYLTIYYIEVRANFTQVVVWTEKFTYRLHTQLLLVIQQGGSHRLIKTWLEFGDNAFFVGFLTIIPVFFLASFIFRQFFKMKF